MDSESLVDPAQRARLKDDMMRFLMSYRFGIEEMMTKVNILKDEFHYIHAYNPIEHVSSRLKSPEGILKKAVRKGIPLTLEDLRTQIYDIAGIRVTCSFVSDIYTVRDMIMGQSDVTVLEVRDYIAAPKPNGYQSLHLIVSVPVFLSDRTEQVIVEIQIRTIAMDFWASLEHKIFYKYDGEVPQSLLDELKDAADVANRLDHKMERLHSEVMSLDAPAPAGPDDGVLGALRALPVPDGLLDAFISATTDHSDRKGQGGRGPL